MAEGDGGEIETVLYSAACGAVSSTATAGHGATVRIAPINIANRPTIGTLPGLPDRPCLFRNVIRRRTSRSKIGRNLSQRFRDSKPGSMIGPLQTGHGNLRSCHDVRRLIASAVRGALCAG